MEKDIIHKAMHSINTFQCCDGEIYLAGLDEYGNDLQIWAPVGYSSEEGHLQLTGSQMGQRGHDRGYIEKSFIYNVIGDVEVVSSSAKDYNIGYTSVGDLSDRNGVQFVPAWEGRNIDYSDPRYFSNRIIIDKNKGFKHKPYIDLEASGVNFDHTIDGRPVGRTSYFVTSSTGDIIYPSNHYINFPTSKESPVMSKLFYEGVKWSSVSLATSDQFGNIFNDIDTTYTVQDPKFEDPFPESPFYSINVGGSSTERQLIVRRNKK